MGFFRRVTTFTAALAVAVPVAVMGGGSASAATCLDGTRTSFHALGSPFTGGTTLTWSVSTACSTVSITVNGQAVGRTGSMTVHPATTTKYVLKATASGTTVTLGSRTAIAGRVIGYVPSSSTVWLERENYGPGVAKAKSVSGRLLAALSQGDRTRFIGKVIEVHIIPGNKKLTELYPFTELERTGGVVDRDWSTVRGMGGLVIEGTNRVAVAVGAEELGDTTYRSPKYGPGYVMAHELAHAIMDHMSPITLEPAVGDVLAARGTRADYLGDDTYTKSNADEYWAESSAALFEYEYGSQFDQEYNEQWLVDNDPQMHRLVSRTFPGR